ncbi:aldehyde dehydrogenase family protein [Oceanobacillus profundus]|uniref:aldehyde dehydrogenase family protein n=1 Tax=Oceanobacillus TaxID=182709 RepID=UPI00203C6D14|nr:aldehyde dehydrogenase family protein [Oceanobacillus profundus]MCM3397762.1 aldehyde dehydrogenase family protein [Oceanobacillus profundus]
MLLTDVQGENFINGKWEVSKTGEVLKSINPATNEVIGTAQKSSLQDIRFAIETAYEAFQVSPWRLESSLRSNALMAWANKMIEGKEYLATLLTKENGKSIQESRKELAACIDTIKYFAGMARSIFGRTINLSEKSFGLIDKQPIGVVGIISPWNWPALLMIREVAPALAAGNTVVIKPASQTPLISIALIGLIDKISEFPSGVANIVSGPGALIGNEIAVNPHVGAISFTGDTSTGKNLMKVASEKVKKLALELGGKSPHVVFPDANLEKAIPIINSSMFSTSGQMCFAGTRVIVHNSIHDELVELLKQEAENLKVGNGLEESVDMGPVISKKQFNEVMGYIKYGKENCRLVTGGNQIKGGVFDNGFYIEPTIFTDVSIESKLAQDEIFGPVLVIQTFKDEEEAIQIANGTSFGLAAGVWTKDIDRAMRVSKKIDAGTVWINTYNKNYPQTEFGGYKESGLGRTRGIEGLLGYTETKHINVEFD